MALRALMPTPAQEPSDTTLAFAFDHGYLEPFKALLRSMMRVGTLLDCPIAIYSDDPQVFEDPMVQLVIDKPRLIEGDERAFLHQMARDTVKRPERGGWNRGTFLKWAVFEPQPTSQVLFLDVDMIVLAPLERLLRISPKADILCAPQFQKSIYSDETQNLSREAVHDNLSRLMTGELWGAHRSRINSGLMLVRDTLLSGPFRDELIAHAQRNVAINEQGHMSTFFKEHSYKRKMLSVKYNFQESFLSRLTPEASAAMLSEVVVLHYAGSPKPWRKTTLRESEKLWFQA